MSETARKNVANHGWCKNQKDNISEVCGAFGYVMYHSDMKRPLENREFTTNAGDCTEVGVRVRVRSTDCNKTGIG